MYKILSEEYKIFTKKIWSEEEKDDLNLFKYWHMYKFTSISHNMEPTQPSSYYL